MLISSCSNHRLILSLVTFVTLILIFTFVNPSSHFKLLDSIPSLSHHGERTTQLVRFWNDFSETLYEATPRCALPETQLKAPDVSFELGKGTRPDLINLSEGDIAELTSSHAWFVEQISRPDYPRPSFDYGSSGIVTSAGGRLVPGLVVMLRMLRRTGSTLPVEVYFQDEEEMEQEVCDAVLKDLGAQCHVLSRIFDADGGFPRRHNISHFQVKAFALLFSRFDNMLWLDADDVPLQDPRKLLESDPYQSHGLVTWPDYWYPSSSHLFYDIANISIPDVGLRASSETGQILLNKSKHLRTLELAAYYNYFGPSHYYQLLSQGASGEGDKETFLAAAQALKGQFWAVGTKIGTLGYLRGGSGFRGVTMLQADPVADFLNSNSRTEKSEAAPVFLHNSQFKPNAERYAAQWKSESGTRIFGPKDSVVARFGIDLEHIMWDEMVTSACELKGCVYKDWIGKDDVCGRVKETYVEVFSHD